MTGSTLTDQQLNEIEARLSAASKGPWKLSYEYCDCSEDCGHGLYVSRINTGCGPATELCELPRGEWELMVHARQDVEQLVAEVRRLRADRNRYRNAWHNARARAADGWADAKLAETRAADLDAARRADNDRIAELEPYEMLTPQQCPAGKHADWLVDSEYAHACPWCQIEELRAATRPAVRPAVETGA